MSNLLDFTVTCRDPEIAKLPEVQTYIAEIKKRLGDLLGEMDLEAMRNDLRIWGVYGRVGPLQP